MKKLIIFSFLILFLSVNLHAYIGDGLGDHKARKDLDMNGNKIDGVVVYAIPIATATLQAQTTTQQAEIDALAHGNVDLYLTDNISNSDQYYLALTSPVVGVESTFVKTITGSDISIASWTTNVPLDLTILKKGTYEFHGHFSVSSVVKETRVYFTISHSTGGAETFLFTSELSNILTTTKLGYGFHASTVDINTPVGYMVFRLFASATGGGGNPDLTFYMEGDNSVKLEFSALQSDTGVTQLVEGTNIDLSASRGIVTVSVEPDIEVSTITAIDSGGLMLRNDAGTGGLHIKDDGTTGMKGSIDGEGHDATGFDNVGAVSFTGDGAGLTGLSADEDIPATGFYTQGFGNVCSLGLENQVEGTYRNVVSSFGAWYIKFPDTSNYNWADAQEGMTLHWDGADFILYATFTSTGITNGNAWFEIGITTCPGVADAYTVLESTTDVGDSWCDVRIATFSVTGTGLGAGRPVYYRWGRNYGDSCAQTIYGVKLTPDPDVD